MEQGDTLFPMRPYPPSSPDEKLERGYASEPGYDGWLRAKIERAVAETREPGDLIPAEQVWRDLDLET